jgi:hypothetical protein
MNVATLLHVTPAMEVKEEFFFNHGLKKHNFKDIFSYWTKEKEDYSITFIILDKMLKEHEFKILFSFLKNEEMYSCIGIHPLVAVKNEQRIGTLIFFEDVVEFSSTSKFLENDFPPNLIRQKPLFCHTLRRRLLGVFHHMDETLMDSGTVVAFSGYRTETASEGLLFQRWDLDAISPTISPEVFIAKKTHIHYAPIGILVRRSANLEPFEQTEAENQSQKQLLQQLTSATLQTILTNSSIFSEVSEICDKIEFKELLM